MRTLIIGFVVLAAWMAFSTYIYVCKVKGLCGEPVQVEVPTVDEAAAEAIPEPVAEERAVRPADLTIYFGFDRSDFTPEFLLDNYITESTAYLKQNAQARLRFTGHTCSIGTEAYNQALGMRRAQSARQYFESKGAPLANAIVESRGESEPAENNQTAAGREKNRRTVITIIE